jgi:nanoRNase/pAp phosphatase (c-di-AMP/oligoRNAs hydrolase)
MSVTVEFEGHKIYAINAPHIFASVVGNKLALKTNTFALVWRQEPDGVHASMRSVREFDVSVIAKKYGGGGHKNAASFKFEDFSKIPWKIIKDEY